MASMSIGTIDVYKRQLEPYHLISKQRWSGSRKTFVDVPLVDGADGVAVNGFKLWEGAERITFRCVEVAKKGISQATGRMRAEAVGEWLVAKETKYVEQLEDAEFHQNMAKLQSRAQQLADNFNARVGGKPEQQISFVECVIYKVSCLGSEGGFGWLAFRWRQLS